MMSSLSNDIDAIRCVLCIITLHIVVKYFLLVAIFALAASLALREDHHYRLRLAYPLAYRDESR
jgi:hypothetical protein